MLSGNDTYPFDFSCIMCMVTLEVNIVYKKIVRGTVMKCIKRVDKKEAKP